MIIPQYEDPRTGDVYGYAKEYEIRLKGCNAYCIYRRNPNCTYDVMEFHRRVRDIKRELRKYAEQNGWTPLFTEAKAAEQ